MPRAKKSEVPATKHPKGVKARVLYQLSKGYHHRQWVPLDELLADIQTSSDDEIATPSCTTNKLRKALTDLGVAKLSELHPSRAGEYRATSEGRNLAGQISSF